jgi:hypothetical protein
VDYFRTMSETPELAELRTLLLGVPGSTLAGQIQALLQDRARLDWIEAWLKGGDGTRYIETYDDGDLWLFAMGHIPDSYGPVTIAKAPTLRAAVDAAMAGAQEES